MTMEFEPGDIVLYSRGTKDYGIGTIVDPDESTPNFNRIDFVCVRTEDDSIIYRLMATTINITR
jgi:hypothetical protein